MAGKVTLTIGKDKVQVENKVYVSAGHGDKVAGANGYIKEHEEAVKVAKRVTEIMTDKHSYFYVEKTAKTQNQNLANIAKAHNAKKCALNVSVHFNSSAGGTATGTEVLYFSKKQLASDVSKAIANSLGLKDRGAKERQELYFLRNTATPSILLEICFVSTKKDTEAYKKNFEAMCQAIAKELLEYIGEKKPNAGSKPSVNPSKPSESHKDINGAIHTVVKGETLYKVAKEHGISVEVLASLNNISDPSKIQVGDKLIINNKRYLTNAKQVKVLKGFKTYKDVEITTANEAGNAKKGDTFTITNIVRTKAGTPRFKTDCGVYITANKEFVERIK